MSRFSESRNAYCMIKSSNTPKMLHNQTQSLIGFIKHNSNFPKKETKLKNVSNQHTSPKNLINILITAQKQHKNKFFSKGNNLYFKLWVKISKRSKFSHLKNNTFINLLSFSQLTFHQRSINNFLMVYN